MSRLSPQQEASFREDGFLVLRDAAPEALRSPILAWARTQLQAAAGPLEYEADLGYPGAPADRAAPGGGTVRRLLRAWERDPAVRALGTRPELLEPLRQLLGAPLRLSQAHHNCVMTKQPRYSSLTGWHQDIRYWNFEPPELISAWLALGEETPENGCLWMLPGTHRQPCPHERLDAALFLREDLPENAARIATRVPLTLAAGDLALFHARTFHAAGANRTPHTKFALVLTFHGPDTVPVPGTRSAALPEIAL